MLEIREQTATRMVLGPRRSDELVGLFLFGLGLLSVGLGLALLVEGSASVVGRSAGKPGTFLGLFFFFQYAMPLGVVGFIILFAQRKFVFDAEHGVLVLVRWMRQPQSWKFSNVTSIVVIQSTEWGGHCELHFTATAALRLGSGGTKQCAELAYKVHKMLNVPIQHQNQRR